MRVRLVISGRVQGVGFRWFVREAARRHRLAGWVRNRSDGNVVSKCRAMMVHTASSSTHSATGRLALA